jgi:hypothetical protein
MIRLFGHFIERKDDDSEHLQIGFSPTSIPFSNAGAIMVFQPIFSPIISVRSFPATIVLRPSPTPNLGAVSYVANELLENAMKFSYAPSQHAISIAMYLEAEAVSLYVTNSVDPHAVAAFQQAIARLLTEDTDTRYMAQLTHNTESDSADGSSLGYLTMLHDYGVTLAWKFAPSLQDPDVTTVTTMARLSV